MDPIDKSKVDVVVGANASLEDRIKAVRDAIHQTRVTVTQSSEPILALTGADPLKALMIASMSCAFMWTLAKALAFSRI
jgi:hypothetical protein